MNDLELADEQRCSLADLLGLPADAPFGDCEAAVEELREKDEEFREIIKAGIVMISQGTSMDGGIAWLERAKGSVESKLKVGPSEVDSLVADQQDAIAMLGEQIVRMEGVIAKARALLAKLPTGWRTPLEFPETNALRVSLALLDEGRGQLSPEADLEAVKDALIAFDDDMRFHDGTEGVAVIVRGVVQERNQLRDELEQLRAEAKNPT